MTERGGNTSPEARTAQFFDQDVARLTAALVSGDGMIIAIPGSNRRIQLVEVEPFGKARVGVRYREMNGMEPGDLWNPPMRRINQSLIVAQDRDGVGACVRLLRAYYFDQRSGTFVPTLKIGRGEFAQREGDIANYLRLGRYDRSRLEFIDDSDVLYLTKGGQTIERIRPEDANRELEKLVHGK